MDMIRNAVVREIRRRKKSGYEFAHSLKGTHPVTIMKWIYSGRRVSMETVEKVLAALDLVVVPKSSKKVGQAS